MSAGAKIRIAVGETMAELRVARARLLEMEEHTETRPLETSARLREIARIRGKLEGLRLALFLMAGE